MEKVRGMFKDESGQVLPTFALLLVLLIGFAAIAIDGGQIYQSKANAFNIAEASALSASVLLSDSANDTLIKDTAVAYALENGAKIEDVKVTTQYNVISSGGDKLNKVTVEVSFIHTMTFAKFIGKGDRRVSGKHSVSIPVK